MSDTYFDGKYDMRRIWAEGGPWHDVVAFHYGPEGYGLWGNNRSLLWLSSPASRIHGWRQIMRRLKYPDEKKRRLELKLLKEKIE